MRDALEAGRDFEFEIRSGNARLIGGILWAAALKDFRCSRAAWQTCFPGT